MAISATTGRTINNAVAGTSLVFAATTTTTGQAIVLAVAILDTTKSVSSVVASPSGSVFTLKTAQNNGSAVRLELWECQSITGNAADVITVNFSGSTLASGAWEAYSGSTALGNIGTASTGTGFEPQSSVTTQDNGSFAVAGIAIASSSGDTFTAALGTIRQSLVPALTTAGVALIDNTTSYISSLRNQALLNNSRAWVSTGLELRTGVSPNGVSTGTFKILTNIAKGSTHQVVKNAVDNANGQAVKNFGAFS